MSWQRVDLAQSQPRAWRNGGGITRELLAWPPGGPAWKVRLSIADVTAAGPFSRFDGVERWFAVLEGAGVRLRVHGREHVLTAQSPPFRFDGDSDVGCELVAGATRDFNLMAQPGRARMLRVSGGHAFATGDTLLLAAYSHRTPARLVLDGHSTEIGAGQLAWRIADRPCAGSVGGEDLLWIEASP